MEQEKMAPGSARGGLGWILGKFLHRKRCPAQSQAAQGSDSVPIPEGIEQTCTCGIWGHGLVSPSSTTSAVLGEWLDSMISEGFCNANYSVILYLAAV